MTWRDQAACKGADQDLFFPEDVTVEHVRDVKRRYCDGCPVRQECLDTARSDRTTAGIHGGMMFPLVGPKPYVMELLRLEGWSWQDIADHFKMGSADAARVWVNHSFALADKRTLDGKQMLNGKWAATALPKAQQERPLPPALSDTSPEGIGVWCRTQRAAGFRWKELAKVSGLSVKHLEWSKHTTDIDTLLRKPVVE